MPTNTLALNSELERICRKLYSGSSTPVARRLLRALDEGDINFLALAKVDPKDYLDAKLYLNDAALVGILRKCKDLPTTIDKRAKAVEAFWVCEKQCYAANERLSPYLHNSVDNEKDLKILEFISELRKEVAIILGPCPDLCNERFGPGGTFADKGEFTTIPDKIASTPTMTQDSWPLLAEWSQTLWAAARRRLGGNVEVVNGNRFLTVDKDAGKDRGICPEPSFNGYYQLGLAGSVRNRLLLAGIHLDVGQDIHRRLAYEASIRGHLATLDATNASDTICLNFVRLALPERWYRAFYMLRSPKTLIDGVWVKLEKFSSMGNGYTFELETLLFYAVCATICKLRGIPLKQSSFRTSKGTVKANCTVSVFGDDMIVPSEIAKDVKSVLDYFGIKLNEGKSFSNGGFRESCGGDYFNGMDVRPFHLEATPCEPQDWVAFANGLHRVGSKLSAFGKPDGAWLAAWRACCDNMPAQVRSCCGPLELGDIVLHGGPMITRWRSGIRYIRVYRPVKGRKVPWSYFSHSVVLAGAVYGIGSAERTFQILDPHGLQIGEYTFKGGPTVRGDISGYKLGWCAWS